MALRRRKKIKKANPDKTDVKWHEAKYLPMLKEMTAPKATDNKERVRN